MEKIQDIELTIKDLQKDGVFAISLVENPAIEEDFIYLNSHQIELKVVDEEKRIVVGYALIPDKKIYRNVNGKEFNIFFSAETVRQSAELYMANLKQNSVTVNHEKKIEGAGVIESWITEDEKHDKINLYSVKPIVGGWVVMMKINNDEEWQAVKRGEYKGFSIEARYDGFEQLKQNKMENVKEELKKIIQQGLELESQNVKLGLMDDAKNQISEYGKLSASITSVNQRVQSLVKEYKSLKLRLDSNASDAMKLLLSNKDSLVKMNKTLTSINKAEKELGISLPQFAELSKIYRQIKSDSDILVDSVNLLSKEAGLSYTPSKLPIM